MCLGGAWGSKAGQEDCNGIGHRTSDVCWLWCEAGAVVGFGESENFPIYWHNSQLNFYPHCSCWWGSTYYQSWETKFLWPKYIVPICLSVRRHPNAVLPQGTHWASMFDGWVTNESQRLGQTQFEPLIFSLRRNGSCYCLNKDTDYIELCI